MLQTDAETECHSCPDDCTKSVNSSVSWVQDLQHLLDSRDVELKSVRERLREEISQKGGLQRELDECKLQHGNELASAKMELSVIHQAGGSPSNQQLEAVKVGAVEQVKPISA